MSDAEPPAPRGPNVVPMLRRLGEAVKIIIGFVHSVEQLKRRNDVLATKVDELQRKIDQQAGQLEVLLRFVTGALDDRIEKRAKPRHVLPSPGWKKSGVRNRPARNDLPSAGPIPA
jgi:hypothetical protein